MAEHTEAMAGENPEAVGQTLASVLEKQSEKQGEQIPHEVVSDEKLEHSRVRYSVRVPSEEFARRIDEVIADLRREVAIPGFRRGKAPVQLVRNRFGKNAKEDAVRKMVPRLAELVAAAKSVESLTEPSFEGWEEAEDGTALLRIVLEVRPEISITDDVLKGIEVEACEHPVTDEQIAAELQRLREANVTFEAREDAVYEDGDAISYSLDVRDPEGNRIASDCVDNHYTTNPKGSLPDEVYALLPGMTKGDVREAKELILPVDDEEKLTGNAVLTIHEVKKRVLPELDDEFAKDVSAEYETLEDLRSATRKEMEESEQSRQRTEILAGIYEVLRERLEFDLPPSLVARLAERSIMQAEERLNQYGMSLRRLGRDYVDRFINKAQSEAIVDARNLLIVDQVGRFLAVEATDEMVDAEIARIAEAQGRKPLAIRAALEANKRLDGFKADLRVKAINDRLVAMANVKIVEHDHHHEHADSESAGE